jgi:hypothetical protein
MNVPRGARLQDNGTEAVYDAPAPASATSPSKRECKLSTRPTSGLQFARTGASTLPSAIGPPIAPAICHFPLCHLPLAICHWLLLGSLALLRQHRPQRARHYPDFDLEIALDRLSRR